MSHTPNDQWLISGKQAKEISGLLSGYKVQAKIDEILESLPEASFELRPQAAKIEAQLAAVQADAAWQPIETAPKDGIPLLIFGGIQHPEIGSSQTITRATLASWLTSRKCWDVLDCDYYSVSVENPTHWIPLPKSPTAIAKDTQEQS